MDGPWTWTVRGRVAVPPRLPRGCSAEARQRGTTLRRKSVRGLEGPGQPEGRGAAAVFDAGEAAEIAGSTGRSEDPSDARDGERDERTASRCRGVPCGYSDGRVAAPPRGATWIFRGTAAASAEVGPRPRRPRGSRRVAAPPRRRRGRGRGDTVVPPRYLAPSAVGVMREADFDYGTEMATLIATQPLPITSKPAGAMGLSLDVDADGRVSDRERIMRAREPCCTQFWAGTCCSAERFKWSPAQEALERGAAAAHVASLEGEHLVFRRLPHRNVVPKNFTTTDKYGHKFAGVAVAEHEVSALEFAVPARFCRVDVIDMKDVAHRPLYLDPALYDGTRPSLNPSAPAMVLEQDDAGRRRSRGDAAAAARIFRGDVRESDRTNVIGRRSPNSAATSAKAIGRKRSDRRSPSRTLGRPQGTARAARRCRTRPPVKCWPSGARPPTPRTRASGSRPRASTSGLPQTPPRSRRPSLRYAARRRRCTRPRRPRTRRRRRNLRLGFLRKPVWADACGVGHCGSSF